MVVVDRPAGDTDVIPTAPRLAAAAILLAVVGSSGAVATDYFHECRTADGRYVILDGDTLQASDAAQVSIPFETLGKTVLSERRGYCQSRGKQFEFEARSYVLKIRFKDRGAPIETDAMCELATDGLPAAYKCEREFITHDFKLDARGTAKPASTGAVWLHNGSTMRLEANGAERRFVYDTPRPGMIAAGVKRGDVLFEGRRDGNVYAGSAAIFSRRCGRLTFPVRGSVASDQRSVTLEGQAPQVADDCSVRGHRADSLTFELPR